MNLDYQTRRTIASAKRYLGDGDPALFLKRLGSVWGNIGPSLRGELVSAKAELGLVVIRADGRTEDLGVVSRRKVAAHFVQSLVNAMRDPTQTDEVWVTLATYKFCGFGVGTNAEGANGADYNLQTEITDQARVSGTVTDVSVNPAGKYQVVGTMTFTVAKAVTEFGLFTGTDRNSTTINGAQAANTTPLLVGSTTGFSGTGDIFTQGQVIKYTSVDATHFIGCTQGNSAITLANSRGVTAAGMLDRKQFSVINVAINDSIQATYTLTINPEA